MPPAPGQPAKPSPPTQGGALAQARALLDSGKADECLARLRVLAQRKPTDGPVQAACAEVLYRTGQAAAAEFHARRAIGLLGDDATLTLLLANTLSGQGKSDEALTVLRKAAQTWPDNPHVLEALIGRLDDSYLLDEAERLCSGATGGAGGTGGAAHGSVAIRILHSGILHRLGRGPEATTLLRALQTDVPHDPHPAVQLASLLNYDPTAEPEQVAAAHRRAGMLMADHTGPPPWPVARPTNPEKPLRVGVLSPDFSAHSVAFFAKPLVAGLKAAGCRTHCYHVGSTRDRVTQWFSSTADRFVYLPASSSFTIAQAIRDDEIDVLFELAGYTAGNRQAVVSLRPAPVQVTAIGYPSTTGNPAVQARLVDSLTDPPGSERLCTERLMRVDPCFLCYSPPEGDDLVATRPPIDPAGSEPITFGSFNALMKLSPPLLSRWRAILEAVPGSRLLLKGSDALGEAGTRAFQRTLADAGVPLERVELLTLRRTRAEHFRLYHRVDIALDTFPYNGTTTTCEALLMGVPVVAFAGRTHAARVSMSLLAATGVPELAARDEEGYLALAVELANDRRRLAEYHRTLRARLLSSSLCDVAAYGRHLGEALRGVWRQACELAAGS